MQVPLVHIIPQNWTVGGADGRVAVLVYTNGDAVEMWLNGQSLGVVSVPPFEAASYSIAFAPGNLTVTASRAGLPWASQSVLSTGPPAAVTLRVEQPSAGARLKADGQDTARLVATVVDAKGLLVREARSELTFSLQGNGLLLGTSNGNPSDAATRSDASPVRQIWNGYAMVLVRAGQAPGLLTVTVTSPGLQSATASVLMESHEGFYL